MSSQAPTSQSVPNSTTPANTNSSSPQTQTANSPTGTSQPPPPGLPSPPPKGLPPGVLAALIVGIGLGALLVLIGVGIFVIFYRRKKQKKKAGRFKDDPSNGLPQHWQQNAPSPTGGKVKLLPELAPYQGVVLNPKLSPVFGPSPPDPPSTTTALGFKKPFPSPSPSIGFSQSTFTYEELATATDGFSNANLLGQGGFGYVHKGVLPNGKVVAIKQLKAESRQGEREFQAEIETISRVHHRHLVSLVGYCISGAQRMLVYEFVPNNTLEFHLHGKGRPTMNWSNRLKIAIGSAKGLAYLHEDCHPRIIHRDVKAANILLDDSFEAKVADFGLARYSLDTDTHVSTRVMGTFGYLAPEYASSGKLTEKSDVYSFGVVLLELIAGRRPVDRNHSFLDDSIVDWARPLLKQAWEGGNYDVLVDPKLQKDYDSIEMARMIACAAACVRHSARLRPRMSQIVRALEGNLSLAELSDGMAPGHSGLYSYASSDYDSSQYKEELKIYRKTALETQEHGSSEYSGPTVDFGQLPFSSSPKSQQTMQEMESWKMEKNMVTLEGQEHGSSEDSGPTTSDVGQHPSSSSTEAQQTTQEIESQIESQRMDKNVKDSHRSL